MRSKLFKNFKTIFLLFFTFMFVLSACLLGIGTIGQASAAVETNGSAKTAGYTVKAEFNIPTEARIGGSLAAGTHINRYVGLYNWTGGYQSALEEGDILKYEVYSPTPIPGIGAFVGLEESGSWNSWDVVNPDIVDQNGILATTWGDASAFVGNGWYERTIDLGRKLTVTQGDGGSAPGGRWTNDFCIGLETVAPVPYSKVEVFFRNIRVVKANGEIRYYALSSDAINPSNNDANQRKLQDDPRPLASSLSTVRNDKSISYSPNGVENTDYVVLTEGSEQNAKRLIAKTANVTGSDIPNPKSFSHKRLIGVVSQDVNLWSGIGNANAAELTNKSVKVVDSDGVAVTITGGNGAEVFNTTTEGKYYVTYKATSTVGGKSYPIEYTREVGVYAADEVIYEQADIDSIQKDYKEAGTINLPKLIFSKGGVDTAKLPVVTNMTGDVMPLTENQTNCSFTSVFGKYTVTYTFEETVVTFDILVGVMTADLNSTTVPNGKALTIYELNGLKALDVQNGAVDFDSARVKTPEGTYIQLKKSVVGGDFSFRPLTVGQYELEMTATDFLGTEKVFKRQFSCVGEKDLNLKINYKIYPTGEEDTLGDYREEGKRKFLSLRLFPWMGNMPIFKEGDVWTYEIYTSTPLAGIGMVDILEEGGGWARMFTDYLKDDEVLDTDGNSFKPTTDITEKLVQNDMPTWYKRSVVVPSKLYGKQTEGPVLMIDSTAACGDSLEIYVKNIAIEHSDGTTTYFYDGNSIPAPTLFQGEAHGWCYPMEATVYSTADKFPMLNSSKLPEGNRLEVNTTYTFPKDLFYSFIEDKEVSPKQVTIQKTGSSDVVLTSNFAYKFENVGLYTITALLEDNSGGLINRTFQLDVQDIKAPIVSDTLIKSAYNVGDVITFDYSLITDDCTANSKLSIQIRYKKGNEAWSKNQDKPASLNIFTEEGTYVIAVRATDESSNVSEWKEFSITVTKKADPTPEPTPDPGNKGCGSSIGQGSAWLMIVGALCVGLVFVTISRIRKNR